MVEPTHSTMAKRLSADAAATAGLKRKAPPVIRTEQIREIAQFLSRPPAPVGSGENDSGKKTLEEPGQATLILMQPAVESLLPTLVSRCQRIPYLFRLWMTPVATHKMKKF